MATFNLKKISINNFRSIKEVDLEIKDGLYAIIGKNTDQPSTTNGSGKSSLIYALWWCLTGNSLGGETLADDVVNIQEGKDCKVECFFETDSGDVTIMRCRKYKEHGNNLFLTINGQDLSCHKVSDTQERINQLLKVNFEVLKSTVILTSDIKAKFSDLTPQGRVSLLESIRDYSIWEKVRAESNIDIKAFDSEISSITNEINQRQGSINTYNSLIADLRQKYVEEKSKSSEDSNAALIKTIEDNIQKMQEELNTITSVDYEALIAQNDSNIKQKNEELREKMKESSDKKDEITKKYQESTQNANQLLIKVQEELSQLSKESMSINFEIKNLNSDIDVIQKWFTNDTCPTCNRKLDRTEDEIKQKNQQKEELLSKVRQKEEENTLVNAKILTVESEKTKSQQVIAENEKNCSAEIIEANKTYEDSIAKLTTEIEKITSEQDKLKIDQKNAKNKIDEITRKINESQPQIIALKEQNSSIATRLKEIQDQAEQYKKEVDKIEKEKDKLQAEVTKLDKKKTYAKFFYDSLGPKGSFRGILLAKDIAYINQRLNIYIPKFFTNAELQLTTPSMDKNVIELVFEEDEIKKPVTSLSEGEKKRLNLSTQMAIYDLLQSTSMFNLNLCIFDEIESALDPEGVRQLLEVIDDRQDNFKTAWWITNNETVSSNIFNKIQATKKNGFTKIGYL